MITIEEGDTGRPRKNIAMPIRAQCEQVTIKHYCGMWDSSSKKLKKLAEISKTAMYEPFQLQKDHKVLFANVPRDYFYVLVASQSIN
jgi:hypothetical protein